MSTSVETVRAAIPKLGKRKKALDKEIIEKSQRFGEDSPQVIELLMEQNLLRWIHNYFIMERRVQKVLNNPQGIIPLRALLFSNPQLIETYVEWLHFNPNRQPTAVLSLMHSLTIVQEKILEVEPENEDENSIDF
jgi:hypothetical protein